MTTVDLRPFREVDLACVLRWFDDAETRRWLGGREWPRQALELATRPRRHLLGIRLDGRLVGLIDAEREEDGTASFALITDPAQRRRGIGRAAIHALANRLRPLGVTHIQGGVERGNVASEMLVRRCGFLPLADHDADGFRTYRLALADDCVEA